MSDFRSHPMTGPEAPSLLALEAREAGYKARIQELTAGLEKVRSYNVDIAAGRINYRPHDHIQVIDEALQPKDTAK